ncbi:MAG: hypothetical protein ACTHKB_13310 [Burkholderiaceae bacterium]
MKASLANVEKALLAVCAALLTLVAQAAPSDAGAAAGYPPENFWTRNLQHLLQYADDVGATTGGQVRLTLNAGQLDRAGGNIRRGAQRRCGNGRSHHVAPGKGKSAISNRK